MKAISIFFLLSSFCTFSQIPSTSKTFLAKEFSKEIALYESKQFLFSEVLNNTEKVTEFEVVPLAAANSGELTTLLYKCEAQQKEGLILGFYGNYWNEQGIVYQGYAFKNLDKAKATEFLDLIYTSIENHAKFLKSDNENNNIVFKFEDMDVLICTTADGYYIRIFWNGFDSTWEKTAYLRSKKRFEKKMN